MPCTKCGQATEPRLVHVKRGIAWGLCGLGLFLAWLLGGSLLHDLVEGQRRDVLPLWKALVPLVVVITSVVAGFVRWRQEVCPRCESAAPDWLLAPVARQKTTHLHGGPASGLPGTLTQLAFEPAVVQQLEAAGIATRQIEDVFWMWRVLAPQQLADKLRLPIDDVERDDFLQRVLPPTNSVYWIADRF